MSTFSPRRSRLVLAIAGAALLVSLSVGSVLAGEITGNGKLLDMHGRSECSFSGQEDLQWYVDDANSALKPVPTRGDPSHAQSWGQIPKEIRDFIAEEFGAHPGNACNPTKAAHFPEE